MRAVGLPVCGRLKIVLAFGWSNFDTVLKYLLVQRELKLYDLAHELFFSADAHAPGPCHRNPCKNGGICTELEGNEYKCICPAGFEGKHCEGNLN